MSLYALMLILLGGCPWAQAKHALTEAPRPRAESPTYLEPKEKESPWAMRDYWNHYSRGNVDEGWGNGNTHEAAQYRIGLNVRRERNKAGESGIRVQLSYKGLLTSTNRGAVDRAKESCLFRGEGNLAD